MKTETQPTHTQGKLKANGRFIFAGIGKETKIILEAIKTHDPISPLSNVTREEAEANAQRIVKVVNLCEEIVDALKTIQEYNGKNLLPILQPVIKELIKKAEKIK